VFSERIPWKTNLPARIHAAMHCVKMGSVAGRLIQGADFSSAMNAASLQLKEENKIEDAGRGIDVDKLSLGDPSPFQLRSGKETNVGILLIHGFTASPAETLPLAEYIHRETGWLCRAVLLPGHGTTVEDLNKTDWKQWRRAANEAYDQMAKDLHKPSQTIFLIGISMGASLCCLVAHDHSNDSALKGLILLAPAFEITPWRKVVARILAKMFPNTCIYKGKATERYYHARGLWSYKHLPLKKIQDMTQLGQEAFESLDKIHAATYLFVGELENVVSQEKIREARQILESSGKGHRSCLLPHSQHILTVEPDRHTVFKECLDFMKRQTTP
jgi:carboxylesterase